MDTMYFLPSEVARLVLGYLKESRYINTYKCFMKECPHLAEYFTLLKAGREASTTIMGLSLLAILEEYGRLKIADADNRQGVESVKTLWKQFDVIVSHLRKPTKQTKSVINGVFQQTRCRKTTPFPYTVARSSSSDVSVSGAARCSDSSRRAEPGTKAASQNSSSRSLSPIQEQIEATDFNDLDSSAQTQPCNDVAVESSTFSSQMFPSSRNDSSYDKPSDSNSNRHNSRHNATEAGSVLSENSCANLAQQSRTAAFTGIAGSSATVHSSAATLDIDVVDDGHWCGEFSEKSSAKFSKCVDKEIELSHHNVVSSVNPCSHVVEREESRLSQSDVTKATNSAVQRHEGNVTRVETAVQPPESSYTDGGSSCDAVANTVPDKMDSSQTVAQAGVTPGKASSPVTMERRGFVTPVKLFQAETQEKSPRRKKPKTPKKRSALPDVATLPAPSVVAPLDNPVPIFKQILSDTKLHEKLAETCNMVTEKAKALHTTTTDEEQETVQASKSLEAILDMDSQFGSDMSENIINMSDPVFESLFKLFGTDRDSFHESLQRKADQHTIEELEKSIHEIECLNSMESQKDEGYVTQPTQSSSAGLTFRSLQQSPSISGSGSQELFHSPPPPSQVFSPCHQALPSSPLASSSHPSSPCGQASSSYTPTAQGHEVRSSPQHALGSSHGGVCASQQDQLFSPASNVTQPFSPALTIDSNPNSPQPVHTSQGFMPIQDTTEAFSPVRVNYIDLCQSDSPHSIAQVTVASSHVCVTPSRSTVPVPFMTNGTLTSGQRTPGLSRRQLPMSPLVTHDPNPGSPIMTQKSSAGPVTPCVKSGQVHTDLYSPVTETVTHPAVTRTVFSPSPYSPGTQRNATLMIQSDLGNTVPPVVTEVEVECSQSPVQHHNSINYVNFVNDVLASDSSSTPITGRALSTVDSRAIGLTAGSTLSCFNWQAESERIANTGNRGDNADLMPPPAATVSHKGGMKKNAGKPEGFSTLIGLLSKPPVKSADPANASEMAVHPSAGGDASVLSMPDVSQQDNVTISSRDIKENSIMILSPGGNTLIQVPILACRDETEAEKHSGEIGTFDTQSVAATQPVSICSQNLASCTVLGLRPVAVTAAGAEVGGQSAGCLPLPSVAESAQTAEVNNPAARRQINLNTDSAKKKRRETAVGSQNLKLDSESYMKGSTADFDAVKMGYFSSSTATDTEDVCNSSEAGCTPDTRLTAVPLGIRVVPLDNGVPAKSVFARSLNFGPSAGKTSGSLMPTRQQRGSKARGQPSTQSKPSSTKLRSDTSKLTDVTFRKIKPKGPKQFAVVMTGANLAASVQGDVCLNMGSLQPAVSVRQSSARKAVKPVRAAASTRSVAQAASSNTSVCSKAKATDSCDKEVKKSEQTGRKKRVQDKKATCQKEKGEVPVREESKVTVKKTGIGVKLRVKRESKKKPAAVAEESGVRDETVSLQEGSSPVEADGVIVIADNTEEEEACDSSDDEPLAVARRKQGHKDKIKFVAKKSSVNFNPSSSKKGKRKSGEITTKTRSSRSSRTVRDKVNNVSSSCKEKCEKTAGDAEFTEPEVTEDVDNGGETRRPRSRRQKSADKKVVRNVCQKKGKGLKVKLSMTRNTASVDKTNEGKSALAPKPKLTLATPATVAGPVSSDDESLPDPRSSADKEVSVLNSPSQQLLSPSKEEVLEKLGLTPKKSEAELRDRLQSPPRQNMLDILASYCASPDGRSGSEGFTTPTKQMFSPRGQGRRKSDRKKTPTVKSVSKQRPRTPGRDLFPSPKVSANTASHLPTNSAIDRSPAPSSVSKSITSGSAKKKNGEHTILKPVVSKSVTVDDKLTTGGRPLSPVVKLNYLSERFPNLITSLTSPSKGSMKENAGGSRSSGTPKRMLFPRSDESENRGKKRSREEDRDPEPLSEQAMKPRPVKKPRKTMDLATIDIEKALSKLYK